MGVFAQSPETDTLLNRYEQYLSLTLQPDAKNIAAWINTLDVRGQWPDIGYLDTARGRWEVVQHLERVRDLAAGWAIPASPFYHDQRVWQTFSQALEHWLMKRYRNSNWWQNEIGVPQYMRDVLVLTRHALSPGQRRKAMEVLAQLKVQGTGANLVWSGDLGIHYAALSGNDEKIREYLHRITGEIRITTDNGIQPDHSFHQHGARLQMYQYGKAFLRENVRLAWQLRGTSWAYPEEKLDILVDFILKGWQWMARGINTVPGTMDRSASREGELQSADIRSLIPFLLALLPAKADAFRSMAGWQNGEGLLMGYRYYPYSDFSVYHDKAFSFFLKTISNRTLETESINKENLKGRWLNNGNTYLMHDGGEYYDLMPVWDWDLLPGITICPGAVKPGRRAFTGAVSDGGSGISAMDYGMMDKDGAAVLSMHKCWAVHGNIVVCLLADIRAAAQANDSVCTVLDQCRWRGKVTMNAPGNTLAEGVYQLGQVRWVHHAGFAYIPLVPATISLQLKRVTGTWTSINSSQSSVPVTDTVFSLVLQHRLHGQGGASAYVLASCPAAEQAGRLVDSPSWKVLRNDKDCQAVAFNDGTIMAAFFSPVRLKEAGCRLKADRPCLIMIVGSKVFASDPTCRGGVVHITWLKKRMLLLLPKDGTTAETISL